MRASKLRVRKPRFEGPIAFIPLNNGDEAIVDADDAEFISQWNWTARVNPKATYAFRNVRVNGRQKMLWMHRVLMGAKDGEVVDHLNGNAIDNRRCNLRLCNQAENMWNRLGRTKNGFPGITERPDGYLASLRLGVFKTPEEAKAAIITASIQLNGDRSPEAALAARMEVVRDARIPA